MATTLRFKCNCGQGAHIFIPKKKLFGEIFADRMRVYAEKEGKSCEKILKDAEQTDIQDEADGDLKSVKHIAKMAGALFVDGSKTDKFICPRCGEVHHIAVVCRRE